ncbi:hypothetical protein [Rhizobium sp. L51/94]|uniref:hypothetical protein n=1 Tax=Rhizobium sp. L51/94 TaxID=2819999 RepID=UPI001C5AA261|nr:hypothetical protein [Rhizobium sp. L51/94]QXZ80925.1 hypothetical protein J5274_18565 [Rhizobium sp. L51/94]
MRIKWSGGLPMLADWQGVANKYLKVPWPQKGSSDARGTLRFLSDRVIVEQMRHGVSPVIR